MFSRYIKQISYEVADLNNFNALVCPRIRSNLQNIHQIYIEIIILQFSYHVSYQTSTPISARYSSISQKDVEGWCGVLSVNRFIIIYTQQKSSAQVGVQVNSVLTRNDCIKCYISTVE